VGLLVGVAYSVLAIDADKHLNKAFVAANQGNLDQVLTHVNGATRRFDQTGDRAFVAARALTLCAEKLQSLRESSRGINDDTLTRARATAIDAAMKHAGDSLAHTLTPDSNYLLLAYLASLSGDVPRLHSFAAEALKWDPRFANSRWLMAEAYLAEGNREQAAREAELALDINPSLRQARIVLARARGKPGPGRATVEESIERARGFISAGKPARAEKVLRRAIARSRTPCPECHRLLASIYEAANLYEDAITEWRSFMTEAPDKASAKDAASRIDALKQRTRTEK
jgi:tetratricopeptide (TPR) repeat protein